MENTPTKLAPHEALELRELLSTEIVGLKKVQASMAMVEDNQLKSFMQTCATTKKGNIEAMQQFVEAQQSQQQVSK